MYMVFIFDDYYPAGGFRDLYKIVDTFTEAEELAHKCLTVEWSDEDGHGDWYFPYDNAQIVATDDRGSLVRELRKTPEGISVSE